MTLKRRGKGGGEWRRFPAIHGKWRLVPSTHHVHPTSLHMTTFPCPPPAMDVDYTNLRVKRHRSSSASSSASSTHSRSSRSVSPPPKFHRSGAGPASTSSAEFICYLPPSCHQPGSASHFSTSEELERHHLQLHNHICLVAVRDHPAPHNSYNTRSAGRAIAGLSEASITTEAKMPEGFVSGSGRNRMRECGKVFPDERFLELVSEHECLCHLVRRIIWESCRAGLGGWIQVDTLRGLLSTLPSTAQPPSSHALDNVYRLTRASLSITPKCTIPLRENVKRAERRL